MGVKVAGEKVAGDHPATFLNMGGKSRWMGGKSSRMGGKSRRIIGKHKKWTKIIE